MERVNYKVIYGVVVEPL